MILYKYFFLSIIICIICFSSTKVEIIPCKGAKFVDKYMESLQFSENYSKYVNDFFNNRIKNGLVLRIHFLHHSLGELILEEYKIKDSIIIVKYKPDNYSAYKYLNYDVKLNYDSLNYSLDTVFYSNRNNDSTFYLIDFRNLKSIIKKFKWDTTGGHCFEPVLIHPTIIYLEIFDKFKVNEIDFIEREYDDKRYKIILDHFNKYL